MKELDTLVHQRRAMWEDMGIDDKRGLDEADRVYRRWARTRLKSGSLLAWVAETQNEIVGGGCVWLQPIQPRPGRSKGTQPYLLSMYTDRRYRRKGVASQIIRKAVEWSRKNGYASLRLHASEVGRKLYLRHGFTQSWEMKLEFKAKQRK